ncbi:MAG: uroporphyrinogen-III synthase [Endozoicomonadaceae bacterium]|nr:uroporphyrinogen-III synthase [Endozoicomonadaceae bacterium]
MPLSSWVVWVARPQPDNQELCQLIAQYNGVAYALPMICITPLPLNKKAVWLTRCYDHLIIMSKPAAKLGWPLLKIKPKSIYAIGSGTAGILRQQAVSIIQPNISNSLGLLSIPVLQQVMGQHILIFKGQDGFNLLRDTLRHLGANVTSISLYQREPIQYSETASKIIKDKSINCLVITSGQILEIMSEQLIPHAFFTELLVLVPSDRLYQQAKLLGFSWIVNMQGASSRDVIDILKKIKP